jgi:addiction module RelE/StbE family toxin
MAELDWSPRSIKDINEIAEFISKDSIQYASEQVNQFFAKVVILEKHPFAGRMVPELKTSSLRQILCGHYRIIYEVLESSQVAIVTAHHQSRLLKNNPAIKQILKRRKQNK